MIYLKNSQHPKTIHGKCKEDEKKPWVIYDKESNRYTIQFKDPVEFKKQQSNVMQYVEHVNKIQECLPLLKEMKQNIKKSNKVVTDIPEYVPKFGEMATVIDYDFDKVKFQDSLASDWSEYNPIRKLGLYENVVTESMYDDVPGQGPDFGTPHMGIFNNEHYCDEHDNFIINNPQSVLEN